MDKFNLESAKFVSIVIGICFIFIMVVWKAFDYIPQTEVQKNIVIEENIKEEASSINDTEEDVNENYNEDSTELSAVNQNKNTSKIEIQKITPLEPIEEETLTSDSFENTLEKAKNYNENGQQALAVSEYQKASSATDDAELKAKCYEEIALIYAKSRRYGSALSAAQRAYNTSPSTAREVLLARLYYKTGDIDKASKRIDNVLKRDF